MVGKLKNYVTHAFFSKTESEGISMRKNPCFYPEHKTVRVIIDSDAACECDDNYANLHALMSRKADVRGVIAEQFGAPLENTMKKSLSEIEHLMHLSGHDIPVFEGQASLFRENANLSEGVSFLITEAFSEDAKPLFVICQGALTNLASALRQEPSLTTRLTAIVIGGINYPDGGFEFNTMNDIDAFNYVMKSDLPIWVVPEEVYSTLQISFFEIWERVAPYGDVGRYLSDSMMEANRRLSTQIPMLPSQSREDYALSFPSGESWALGDSAGIGLLLTSNSGNWHMAAPPFVQADGSYKIRENCRPIRWYDSIDTRFILEDFFTKLKYYYGGI